MRKQYSIEYESDKRSGGSEIWTAGNASTIRSAKSVIRNIRKNFAEQNPRNFVVYDVWADIDPVTNHVPVVYTEA